MGVEGVRVTDLEMVMVDDRVFVGRGFSLLCLGMGVCWKEGESVILVGLYAF